MLFEGSFVKLGVEMTYNVAKTNSEQMVKNKT